MDPAVSPSKIGTVASNVEAELRSLVTPKYVRAAAVEDRVAGVQPQFVVEPANEQELAKALKLANEAGVAVIPRGGGTKLDWGNAPSRADIVLSMKRLNRIVEYAWADLTVTVEAGCTMLALSQTLAQHRQRIALDVLWPEEATVGGVLSTNDSGARRLRFGSLRDAIIGITLALPDGTLARSGGKVVKNVAGYDLPKMATGALGTLGVITRAVFRLYPESQFAKTISLRTDSLEEAQQLVMKVQDSQLAHTALQVRAASNVPPEVDLLLEGTEAGVSAQEKQLLALTGSACAPTSSTEIWIARADLWSDPDHDGSVAKMSVLPAQISRSLLRLAELAQSHQVQWRAVAQATGIACLRLDGQAASQRAVFEQTRADLERESGSLVLLRKPETMPPLDAWGNAGDALALMRAVKQQFDPRGTLNPGRFVGGI